jgi:hypothetical protein
MNTREQRQWALIESLREELRLARAAKPLHPHHEKRNQGTQREAFAPSSSHMATQFAWQPHWERRDQATQREVNAPSSSDMATQFAWQPHRLDQEAHCELPPRRFSSPDDMETLAGILARARGGRRRMISTSLLPRWRLLAVQNGRHQHIQQWLERRAQRRLVKAALLLWKQSHRQRRRRSRQLSSAVLRHCARQRVIVLRRWTAASTFERRRRMIEAQVQKRCATVKMRKSLQLWVAATRCL